MFQGDLNAEDRSIGRLTRAKTSSKAWFLGTAAVVGLAVPATGMAQTTGASLAATTAAANDSSGKVETVIVTARKRSEDILKVPVAVTALTSKDLEARDITTIQDLTNFTPGLTDDQSIGNSARTDRSFQSLIIRGLVESSTNNPTTAVFINGTPVGSPDFLQNLDDVDHVEVLKGPQSAYFGRETFAGAVNSVAKSAGNTLTGDISANIGTRSTEVFSGNLTVPIIADKLSIRAGYTYNSHDGSYKNAANPSQTLGDQRTKGFHVAVTARPIENLTIKAFAMVFQDDDGPAATGIVIAGGAPAGFNQGNCLVAGQPFFCGTLPSLISSVSPAQNTTISNTVNFANLSRAFLADPGGFLGKNDFVHGFGLKRNAYHYDVNVQYDLPSLGASVTYLGSYNHDDWSEISDLGNEDTAAGGQYPGTAGFPYAVENATHDYSHELRIATDPAKPYRGLLGVSYVETRFLEALGVTQYGPGAIANADSTQSQTSSVFFALAYDFTPQLTVNFDGRYQQDKETAYNPLTNTAVISGTSNDFLPRLSVQYKFTPDVMAYATYSKGVNPGTFNTEALTYPAVSVAELNSLGLNTNVVVKPEYISNYELGVKGKFFDGRATLSADIYYDKWTDQLTGENYNFAFNDPANPNNVVGSSSYVPNNTSISLYAAFDNRSQSTAKGIEAEANIIVLEHVTINFAGAVNDTTYDAYPCSSCLPYSQIYPGFNAKGKYLPDSPKYSSAIGVQYDNRAPMFGNATWFVRADYIYKDGVYIQASNTVKTPDINLVNLRGGLNFGNASVEGYVNNLFNNKSYTAGFQNINVGGFFANTTVETGLPQLITAGIRLKYKY